MNHPHRVHLALKSAIAILVASIILFSLGKSSAEAAQAGQSQGPVPAFSWEYQLDFSDASRPGAERQASALALELRSQEVASDLLALGGSNYRLAMAGSGGIAQVRELLYSPLLSDFIGGAVEFEIHMPIQDLQETRLRLESNPTTGYGWSLAPSESNAFIQVGQSTFAAHSRGYGVAAVQTLVVQPQAAGDAILRLQYRRSFQPHEIATRHLRIDFPVQTTAIDLSHPDPVTPRAQIAAPDPAGASNPIAEIPLNKSLPVSFDWRPAGIVPAVRDQGSCGSCWSFGTVGVMESAVKKGGGPLTDLSEQFLISCNNDGWSCNGGLTATKYHYNTLGKSQSQIGAVLESDKPYTASNGTCTVSYAHPYKASSWTFITGSEWTMPTVDQIKNAIYTYGPVTAGVCVDNGWYAYSGGVYAPASNVCSGSTNHQIVLVGWDDSTSSWILRNSWGPGWGESGYMRIRWDTTGATSRVGEGTSWVQYTGGSSVVPTPKAPAGAISDTTPTYKWSKVTGATRYTYQLLKGTTIVYTKNVASTVCSATVCTSTPATVLGTGTYRWKVRAMVGGVWKPNSALKTFTISLTPTPLAPSGPISDTTPTYKWNKIAGVSSYHYQLMKGTALIYTMTAPSTACVGTTCTGTPATVLSAGAYQWRVQALVGGIWRPYSAYKAFTIAAAGPNAGFWESQTGDEFYVTADRNYVDDFAIYLNACGSLWKITHTPLEPIVGNAFSFSGPFYAGGTFTSAVTVSGYDGLTSFYLPNCGTVTASWTYTASWQYAAQPAMLDVEPVSGIDRVTMMEQALAGYRATKIGTVSP